MIRRGSFERRLLQALVLFSLAPTLLLVGAGSYLLSRTVALHTSPASWESVAESGRELLQEVDRVGDPRLLEAAERHRSELSASLLQAGRLEYLNQRVLAVIPILALLLTASLVWLAVRASRRMARELASPIRELVGWSERLAREEPLPPEDRAQPSDGGDFEVLRRAFRTMAEEMALSRVRALEAERTRTWIVMARSVAHELKNSLTPLHLAVRSAERQAEGIEAAREPLQVIRAEAERLEGLARSFSQFGRLPDGPVSEIDLAEMLDHLLRTHLPPQVMGHLQADATLPRISGQHDALARAFANLLLNAAEALGDAGGSVTVIASSSPDGVEIRVQDSGPGIETEHLSRIWEPEFTSKPRGTGFGLALVRRTVLAHGGAVFARNRQEGGAEFRILLPLDGPPGGWPASDARAAEGVLVRATEG